MCERLQTGVHASQFDDIFMPICASGLPEAKCTPNRHKNINLVGWYYKSMKYSKNFEEDVCNKICVFDTMTMDGLDRAIKKLMDSSNYDDKILVSALSMLLPEYSNVYSASSNVHSALVGTYAGSNRQVQIQH